MLDRLELEAMQLDLERTYSVDSTTNWNEKITLGEIFRLTLKRG
jgi:hypothetical protein